MSFPLCLCPPAPKTSHSPCSPYPIQSVVHPPLLPSLFSLSVPLHLQLATQSLPQLPTPFQVIYILDHIVLINLCNWEGKISLVALTSPPASLHAFPRYQYSPISAHPHVPLIYIVDQRGGYTYSVDRNWAYLKPVDCKIESDFCS